jgi:hypothetical protein
MMMSNADKARTGVGFEKDLVRLPGQSVNESLSDYMQDIVEPDLAAFLFAFFLLIGVWVNEIVNFSTNPFLLSLLLVAAMVIFRYRISKARVRIKALKQGRDGEIFVGQILEGMRVGGNIVFHDVIGENFNIDHVLIGPKGIYVIETKAWSKGSSNKGSISYNDGVFKLNGRVLDKNPLNQAKANSKWFSDTLKESTGKDFFVQSVIALPGWYIEQADTKRAIADGVLLLNPKALLAFVKNSNKELSEEDLHLIAYHTARHIKTSKYV